MFTLKFYNGGNYNAVSCGTYSVVHRLSENQESAIGAMVSVYPGLTMENGVDYQVGLPQRADIPNAGVCWVENSAGKTIDKVGPFGNPA